MSQATIDPNLLNNILSVNYIYGPVISGGPSEFQAQVNLKNIHTLEVDTLVYSNIDFGDASGNLYVGSNSGKFAINNSNTTGLGEESLYGQVSNSNVTAVGYGAMGSNTEENTYVVAVGTNAGIGMFNTSESVVIGDSAGQNLSSSTGMVFVGTNAGQNTTQAECDIFIGRNAGFNNTTGSNNVFMGCAAGYTNTTGSGNVFLGYRAGSNAAYSTADDRLLIANNATSNLIVGNFATKQVGINFPAGASPAYGLDVRGDVRISGVAILYEYPTTPANPTLRIANSGTAMYLQPGLNAVSNSIADLIISPHSNATPYFYFSSNASLGIGKTPSYTLDVSGDVNIVPNTGGRVYIGDSNPGYGSIRMNGYLEVHEKNTDILSGPTTFFVVPSDPSISAWYSNGTAGFGIGTKNVQYMLDVSGSGNFTSNISVGGFINMTSANYVIGSNSGILLNPATANNNILFGHDAGKALTTEDGNIFIGSYAGANTAGGANVFIGCNVGINNTTGSNGVMIGWGAGSSSNNVNMGYDVAVGFEAAGGASNGTSTDGNVFIGANSAFNISGTVSRNVIVGGGAGFNLGAGSCNVFIGYNAGRSTAYTNSSNILVIANNSNSNLIVGNFSNKQVGINMSAGVSPSYTLHVSGGPTWSWNTPRAFGYVEGTTLPATLCNSFNISSISDQNILGATLYTISFLQSIPDTNYTILVTPTARAVPVIIKNAGSFTVEFTDLTNTPTTTDFSFVVHWNGNM